MKLHIFWVFCIVIVAFWLGAKFNDWLLEPTFEKVATALSYCNDYIEQNPKTLNGILGGANPDAGVI